jgi:hypothetical protein
LGLAGLGVTDRLPWIAITFFKQKSKKNRYYLIIKSTTEVSSSRKQLDDCAETMKNVNFYQFFRDVALEYQMDQKGISGINKARAIQLESSLHNLQSAYFGCDPVSYSDLDRRLAYTLNYAPKHAVIWRELVQNKKLVNSWAREWNLNSIGPGPGSDVFGILAGSNLQFGDTVTISGLEEEETWRDLFEIASKKYRKETGIQLEVFQTNKCSFLNPRGQVFGSFVLSDAARSRKLGKLLEELVGVTGDETAQFLDFPLFTEGPDGSAFLIDKIRALGFKCTRTPLPQMSLNLKEAISKEMSGCQPLYCQTSIKEEPKVDLLTVTLRKQLK